MVLIFFYYDLIFIFEIFFKKAVKIKVISKILVIKWPKPFYDKRFGEKNYDFFLI